TLERSSVALTAHHPHPERLTAVRAAIEIMDADDVDRTTFNDADTAFHTAMRGRILAAFEEIDDWPALREVLRSEHRAILAAIAAGDPATAAALAEQH